MLRTGEIVQSCKSGLDALPAILPSQQVGTHGRCNLVPV